MPTLRVDRIGPVPNLPNLPNLFPLGFSEGRNTRRGVISSRMCARVLKRFGKVRHVIATISQHET